MRACAQPRVTRPLPVLVALGLAVLFALPTSVALHCNGNVTAIPAGTQTVYLDDRNDEAGDINQWIYLESNGIEGLQSGGEALVEPCYLGWQFGCFADPCRHGHHDTQLV